MEEHMSGYARIASLLEGLDRSAPESVDTAMQRLAAAVPAAGQRGKILVNVGDADQADSRRHWTVPLDGAAKPAGADPPDAEVRCSADTLWSLLDGTTSPVEAFLNGTIRVRGDERLLKRVLRHLAGPEGSVHCT
jgi:hypothetical protein